MQAIPQPRIFHVRVAQISQKSEERQSQFELKLIEHSSLHKLNSLLCIC